MRLDKYLKLSRIIKRRTVAKDASSNDRVLINGKIAKPSSPVKINDEITVTFGNKSLTIKVLNINEIVKKEEAELMYEVIDNE